MQGDGDYQNWQFFDQFAWTPLTFDIHDVLVNHPGPLISESGIKTKDELLELSNKTSIKTFLIGESLLKNLDENSIFSVL